MKKLLLFLPILFLFALSCTNKQKNQNTDNQEINLSIEEVELLENAAEELEQTRLELEEKAKALDSLLNEIEQ